MHKPLLPQPPLAIVPKGRSYRAGKCSQGGVKLPTGGKGDEAKPASAFLPTGRASRFGAISEADGESPDERERSRQPLVPRRVSFRMP